MTDDVTQWLEGLAAGDDTAAERIWERYCDRLVRAARKRLGDMPRRAADEEDVALSAFHSFCRGVSAGRFPRLDDRHDLGKLLMTITARKAVAQRRVAMRRKRGGGAVRGESVFAQDADPSSNVGINEVLGVQPTPEFAAMVSDQCEHLLGLLADEGLRQIALRRLEGYTNEEIARQMDCSLRTVKRRLARIREAWEGEDIR